MCRLGFRAIHLPSFPFVFYFVEYDFSVSCVSGSAFFAFSIHSTVFLDRHHGGCFHFFGLSSFSTCVVLALSCGRVCWGCLTLILLVAVCGLLL